MKKHNIDCKRRWCDDVEPSKNNCGKGKNRSLTIIAIHKYEPVLIHVFYQIYEELENVKMKCEGLEELWLQNYKVTMTNKKREEKLFDRMMVLEEKMKHILIKQDHLNEGLELSKEHDCELSYMHNTMIAKINDMIFELNHIISILNNTEEN